MRVLREEGHGLGRLLECAGMARSSYHYALSHPEGSYQARALGGRRRDILRARPTGAATGDRLCLRAGAGRAHSLQDRAEDDARDGHQLRDSPRDRLPQVQLVQGQGRKDLRERHRRDFAADGPWEKMGTDVTEFKQPWGKAYFAPVYDFGSKEIVAWSTSLHPNMAQQHELLDQLVSRKPKGSRPILHSDMGWQYQQAGWCRRLEEAGVVQSMSRKGNCIDNGATEQVFGHIKDEFFRGRTWPDFESFKADLDDFVVHWNTRRRQERTEGTDPEEFRDSPLRRKFLFKASSLGGSSSFAFRGLSSLRGGGPGGYAPELNRIFMISHAALYGSAFLGTVLS